MARVRTLLLVGTLALAVVAILALGCAGTTGSSAPGAAGTGTAVVSITWPERPEVVAEMIPAATESIALRLYDGETEITGLPGMESLPFNRPEGSDPLPPQTVTIRNVPAKEIRFVAEAHAQQDGQGSRLAVKDVAVAIELGETPTPVAIVLDKIPPPAPTGLTATAEGTTIRLGWTEPADLARIRGYNVYRSETCGVLGALLVQVLRGSPSYVDAAVEPYTMYHYLVRSYDADEWESDGSNRASAAIAGPTRIWFSAKPSGEAHYQIYRMDPDNPDAAPEQVTRGEDNKWHPAVSPNGKTLLYHDESGIWAWDLARSSSRPLTTGGLQAGGAAWSPNGSRIAYHSQAPGGGPFRICVMDFIDSPNAPAVIPDPLPGTNGDDQYPCWTRGGCKLLFCSNRNHPGQLDYDIWTMDADGSGAALLADTGHHDVAPEVSPDGASVLFFTKDNGANSFELFTVALAGGSPVEIPGATGQNDGWCVWSPTGTEVAFLTNWRTQYKSVSVVGGTPQPLTDASYPKWELCWEWWCPSGSADVTIRDEGGVQ